MLRLIGSAFAAVFLFISPLAAKEIGIGLGAIGTQALSGTVQGVQSQTGAGSVTAIAGVGVAGASSGQEASGIGAAFGVAACNGNNCGSAAGNAQQNQTAGTAFGFSAALGGALSGATGVASGQSVGESIGAGQTLYNYGSIFAGP
jgi:hypothetical protein